MYGYVNNDGLRWLRQPLFNQLNWRSDWSLFAHLACRPWLRLKKGRSPFCKQRKHSKQVKQASKQKAAAESK